MYNEPPNRSSSDDPGSRRRSRAAWDADSGYASGKSSYDDDHAKSGEFRIYIILFMVVLVAIAIYFYFVSREMDRIAEPSLLLIKQ